MEDNMYESQYNITEDKDPGDHALSLKFTLGYTSNMIGAVHNLTIGDKKVYYLIYFSGNFFSRSTYRCNIQLRNK